MKRPLPGGRPPLTCGFPAGQARITRYDPRRVEVAVAPNEPGFLVLSDSHYPGWRVAVDGEERPMLLANHVFRAVALGPADREVVFSFEPASFRIGASVSIAVLLLWAGLNLRRARAGRPGQRGKYQRGAASSPRPCSSSSSCCCTPRSGSGPCGRGCSTAAAPRLPGFSPGRLRAFGREYRGRAPGIGLWSAPFP